MLWRVVILIGCLIAIAAILHAWPYASDRGRRFVPFGVTVFVSWAFFYGLLLFGWSATSLPIVFMARLSMALTITLGVTGAFAMKAEGSEKRELMDQLGVLESRFGDAAESVRKRYGAL